ncbi:MAG: hypothetical protein IKF56_00685 [Eggerthellaceae bacterium]|nr:hypothetical protein [Eggerthellaceae bacterium]
MKRAILLITFVVLAFACGSVGCSQAGELASTAADKLSSTFERANDLLPSSGTEGADGESGPFGVGGLSLSSTGILNSPDDVVLVPTDDYAQGYEFEYDGEQFTVYFDTYSWRVYDSYKITNHDDIVIICQALINEHPVYGSDWESYRTPEDMAFEWEQHNIAYTMLPEDSPWRDDAKHVDLDPNDQGKTVTEMYESRMD